MLGSCPTNELRVNQLIQLAWKLWTDLKNQLDTDECYNFPIAAVFKINKLSHFNLKFQLN